MLPSICAVVGMLEPPRVQPPGERHDAARAAPMISSGAVAPGLARVAPPAVSGGRSPPLSGLRGAPLRLVFDVLLAHEGR